MERVGTAKYRLDLPSDMSKLHNVFHVSMLRKYIADPSHVLVQQSIELEDDLSYVEEPVQILDRRVQVLRNKVIPSVKVLWMSQIVEEATWESEESMRGQYPYLFPGEVIWIVIWFTVVTILDVVVFLVEVGVLSRTRV
ncbi:uncharacterized protein LOC130766536 [Actinidia eriantha]|uniref:uncharacterized protein LOC130766536 n=1 Tax=Actinidia eriantha TaxID=165200 RepID=UPI00258E56D2|nr:uncharacterized protein LOC130766536 [Actinidia eriantha]